MTKAKFVAFLAWLAFVVTTLVAHLSLGHQISDGKTTDNPLPLLGALGWALVPIDFAAMGALIVAKRRRNVRNP